MKSMKKNPALRRTGLILAILASAYSGAMFLGHSTAQVQLAPAPDSEYLVGATLWTQTAAEYRALAYQAYNLAKLRFDSDLRTSRRSRVRRAVVVDADETVIDNSRFEAALILRRRSYTAANFTDWCERQEASAVPGAVEFLKYAHARGARIFYVTNRRLAEKECTSGNLKKLGFPDVSEETLLLRADTSSKEPRRQMIAKKHRIVLLIGDNLNDLAEIFEKKSIVDRSAAVDQLKPQFGSRWIVLPNAMYGDWESAIYEYKNLSDEEKALKRRNALKSY